MKSFCSAKASPLTFSTKNISVFGNKVPVRGGGGGAVYLVIKYQLGGGGIPEI